MSETQSRVLLRRIMNMVARGIVQSSDDKPSIQQQDLSLLMDEGKTKVERWQDYGFSSHPKVGAEAVVAFFGGGRDHGMVLKTDDRTYRIRGLQQGEVALYSDEGDTFMLKRGNLMESTTKTHAVKAATKATITSPTVDIGAGPARTAGNVQLDNSFLTLAFQPGAPMHAATKSYVDAAVAAGGGGGPGGGGIPEAPLDGLVYGRHEADWLPVIPVDGGVVDGGNF